MNDIERRGYSVHETPPKGGTHVCGPYRPGLEDWMLYRAINDVRVSGMSWCLVREKAAQRKGGFLGISIWRTNNHLPVESESSAVQPAAPPSTPPTPSSESSPSSPPEGSSRRRARRPESPGKPSFSGSGSELALLT